MCLIVKKNKSHHTMYIQKNEFFAQGNIKKLSSKAAHNRHNFFFSTHKNRQSDLKQNQILLS